MVHGQDIAVAARHLLLQYPFVQIRPVSVLGAVFIEGLAVQPCLVVVPLRHPQLITQGIRQIYHPLLVVRPVIQGHVGDHRLVHRGYLLLQGLRADGTTTCQQGASQSRRQ